MPSIVKLVEDVWNLAEREESAVQEMVEDRLNESKNIELRFDDTAELIYVKCVNCLFI